MAFKFLHQLLQQAQARRKPQPHEIQMLGALLVRYPEVDTAEYEPKYEQLRVNFMVRAELTQTELKGYDELLAESFRSYRHLAGQEALPHVEITAAVLEKLTNVHVTRFIRIWPRSISATPCSSTSLWMPISRRTLSTSRRKSLPCCWPRPVSIHRHRRSRATAMAVISSFTIAERIFI